MRGSANYVLGSLGRPGPVELVTGEDEAELGDSGGDAAANGTAQEEEGE